MAFRTNVKESEDDVTKSSWMNLSTIKISEKPQPWPLRVEAIEPLNTVLKKRVKEWAAFNNGVMRAASTSFTGKH